MREGFLHDLSRIQRDLLPALRERQATERIPPSVEREVSPEEGRTIIESLVSSEMRERLLAGADHVGDGVHLSRDIAGAPEDGTRHAHDFVTQMDDSGMQFLYIDPEHSMGKNANKSTLGLPRRGDMRPKVNIMYGVSFTPEGQIQGISLLRYRAEAIPSDQPRLQNNNEQRRMAMQMLADGEIPEILQGKENEITFRLDLRATETDEYAVTAQAREAANDEAVAQMLEDLMEGKALDANDPLFGQLERFRSIMRTHFPRHLDAGEFKKIG